MPEYQNERIADRCALKFGKWSVLTKKMHEQSLAPQGLQAEKERENANVRNAGWLHSFDADYHYRGSDLHYHVNVSAALSEGGTVW